MRAASSSTIITDPYRAGLALGESLVELVPEVVFLFASWHLSVPELLEGLYDGLGRDEVIVVGNSGDGFYETGGATDYGAAALGLNSGGQVRWQLESLTGLNENLEDKFAALIQRLSGDGEEPALGYIVSDFDIDIGLLDNLLRRAVRFPVAGGLATDDHRRAACFLYVNREIVGDALLVLAAYGDIRFSIAIENKQHAVGHAGMIDVSDGTRVDRINGLSAMEFVERETGKPLLHTDRGVLTVLVNDPAAPDEKRLRAIFQDYSENSGSIQLFGGIDRGDSLQVCEARPDDMISEVRRIAESEKENGFKPVGALIVSCSGRKALLGTLIEHEISALSETFGRGLAIAGFPSAGEIAPLRNSSGYTRNLFHNMTYVSLLIGS